MAIVAIPINFVLQQGNGQVFLNWDIVAGATSYQIQRSTDGVTYSNLATSSVNNYLDAAVTVGTLYYYQVASINSSGTSGFTSPLNIVPTLSAGMTLGQIRLAAQQRCDRVNSNFVTVAEWNSYINQSAFELYDLLTTLYEDYYVAPPATFAVDGTNFQFALPDGVATFKDQNGNSFVARPFYKLLGVDCNLATTTNAWVTLKKFDFISRNRYVFPNITSTFLGVFNLRYRINGNNLYFIPTPSGGQNIRLWYIPRMVQLLKDNDILDSVSGWEEYVIAKAAFLALTKEESDTSSLVLQLQYLKQRIEESAMNRDAGQPDTISDTRSWSERWGQYGPPNGDGGYGGY